METSRKERPSTEEMHLTERCWRGGLERDTLAPTSALTLVSADIPLLHNIRNELIAAAYTLINAKRPEKTENEHRDGKIYVIENRARPLIGFSRNRQDDVDKRVMKWRRHRERLKIGGKSEKQIRKSAEIHRQEEIKKNIDMT